MLEGNEVDLDGYVAGVLQRYESHSSVEIIKQRGIPQGSFDFQPISAEDVKTRLFMYKDLKLKRRLAAITFQ